MEKISTIRNFELGFCLKVRNTLSQQKIPVLINELEAYINENNLTKRGNPISGIDENSSDYNTGKIDIEIIQPIVFQKEMNQLSSIEVVENWFLKLSLHYNHAGNP